MSVRVPGYHLPGIDEDLETESRRLGAVEVETSRLSPDLLRRAITGARRAALSGLRGRSVADVLEILDQVAANWLSSDYHLRQAAEQLLPLATGFSAETIRHGLPMLLLPLRAAPARALLEAELGDCRLLDRVCNGRRATGPALMTHVLSGNIPGLAALPMLLSLALKSAVLVKPASGDPIFPALLAASINEVNEEIGRCLLVANWNGGDPSIEEVAFGESALVVASGSDAAVAAIAAAAPYRFIGHGHKISFAIVGKERLEDREGAKALAGRLAYDVSLWDQQGCLSPQLCYLEAGGRVGATEFAELLAEALTHYACELPPMRLGFEQKAQILRFRQEAEWQKGGGALLASPGSTDWSVSVEVGAEFRPTCLYRCIRLKAVADLSELPVALSVWRRHLEAAGVAVGPRRVDELTEMLAMSGVHRICPLGTMQLPPLSWPQSGRPRLADWVEWVLVEGGLES